MPISLRQELEQREVEVTETQKKRDDEIESQRQEALKAVKNLEEHLEPVLKEVRGEKAEVEVSYHADTHLAEWFQFTLFPFGKIYQEKPMFFVEKTSVGPRYHDIYPKTYENEVYERATALTITIKGYARPTLTISFFPFNEGFVKQKMAFHYEGDIYTPKERTFQMDAEKYERSDSGVCHTAAECEIVLRRLVVRLLAG